ncbi:hypothetical protein [Desulfovibrio sp. SGI.169]|uniref:hypothetical protein n=1 Tax=Desulfovibrio sp. SGI.169 TaxID=3420561 RepID=UPI003CFEF1F9
MRRIIPLFMLTALFVFGTSMQAESKGNATGAVKAGAEVKTAFFEIKIPAGWVMPQPAKEMPNGAVSAVFASEDKKMAVAITAMKAEMDARTIAEQTAANMRKGGMATTELVEKDGFYMTEMRPKAKKDPNAVGLAIFGSTGKECTVTIITGADVQKANELLGVLKPLNGARFPLRVQ